MSNEYFRYKDQVISDADCGRLRDEVLTKDKPLGAQFFEFSTGRQDMHLYSYVFDGHSKYLYGNDTDRPSIVVGRKGAGKSTYLNYLASSKDVIAIPVTSWTSLDSVQGVISQLSEKGISVRAERAACIWESIFLLAIAYELTQRHEELASTIKHIKDWIPSGAQVARATVASIAVSYLQKITSYCSATAGSTALGALGWLLENQIGELNEYSRQLSKALRESGKRAIILIDNEEYAFQTNGYDAEHSLVHRKTAIQGLLFLCGRFNEGPGAIQIRYCVPAEQYFLFKEISATAAAKDFSRLHILQWTVGELVSMIAHRYLLHLHVWRKESPALDRTYRELVEFPIYSRSGALQFMRKVLPERILNGRGRGEEMLVYVVRHFQVLPRQIVALFNYMLARELRDGSDLAALSSRCVTDSVRQQEALISDEVINAYAPRYPEADDIRRKVLPNMPVVFGYSDIRRYYDGSAFEHTGKSVLLEQKAMGKLTDVSPSRFERCLIETGMVGRALAHREGEQLDSNGYLKVEFEYALPGSLDLSGGDVLALHPIFSYQRQEDDTNTSPYLGVYPVDADPTFDLDRSMIRSKYA